MITSFITTLVLLVVLPTTLFNTGSVSNDWNQSCMVFDNSLTRMGLSSLDDSTESTKSLVLLNGVYAARPPIRRCDAEMQSSILDLWGNEAADDVEEEQGVSIALCFYIRFFVVIYSFLTHTLFFFYRVR